MTQPADPTDPPPDGQADGLPTGLSTGLSAYLATLADQVGYEVALEESDPVTGLCPALVVSWALAGARHAGLAHARWLLAGPVAFLREQDGPDNQDGCLHAGLLADVLGVRDRLDRDLAAAAGAYAAACQELAGAGLGLVWPRENHPDQPPPASPAA
jgi:hypothetical protein